MLQLHTPLDVITPLGAAEAHFIQPCGERTYFGVFQTATGENWWWENHLIRLAPCITAGRSFTSAFPLSPEERGRLAPHAARHGVNLD